MRRAANITSIMSVLMSTALLGIGCGGEPPASKPEDDAPKKVVEEKEAAPEKAPEAAPKGFVGKPGRTLLLTQSNFKKNDEGKWVLPDTGELIMLTPGENIWNTVSVKESVSNVLHKALPYGDGILTIGGNEALLKYWTKKDGKWSGEDVWNPKFGGEHNRLRDFEKADIDKDGKDDLAIATHDQGVVAVLRPGSDGGYEVTELDAEPDTFVHEIEIGEGKAREFAEAKAGRCGKPHQRREA